MSLQTYRCQFLVCLLVVKRMFCKRKSQCYHMLHVSKGLWSYFFEKDVSTEKRKFHFSAPTFRLHFTKYCESYLLNCTLLSYIKRKHL